MNDGNSKKDNNDYSMYLYLKNKPSVLFGFLTILVSITTAVINYCYNDYFNQYFTLFGYKSDIIKLPSHNSAQTFFLQFGIMVLSQLVCFYYLTRLDVFWGIIENIEVCSQQLKELKDEAETSISLNNTSSEEIQTKKEIIASVEFVFMKRRETIKDLLKLSLLFSFVSFIFNLFNFRGDLLLSWNKVLISGALAIVTTLIYCLILYRINLKCAKQCVETEPTIIERLQECKDLIKKDISFKNNKLSLSFLLSNKRIIVLIRIYAFSLLWIILVFAFFSNWIIKDNKKFLITEIDSKPYAIIYQDEMTFFLNEISVDDEDVYISTTNHLMVFRNVLPYETKTFKRVTFCESFSTHDSHEDDGCVDTITIELQDEENPNNSYDLSNN